MQVTETVSDGLKREYKVVVDADDMAQRIDARLNELQRTVRLKGFRPGKVPVSLLKKQFGSSVVSEVVQQTLQDSSGEVITQQGVRPALQPRVEEMSYDEGQDLEYTLAVELMPEIETGDFSGIELERLDIQVNDEEVDEAMQRLLDRSRQFVDTEEGYAAEDGDGLSISYTGTIDGEAFEGGSAEDQFVELGGGRLLPEFETSLEGHKAGDSITTEVTFPDDYGTESLAGKTASFEIEVKEVRKLQKATLDDEFAKRQGAENVDDLKSRIRDRLALEYGQLARQRLKRALLDKLAETYEFDVPASLVDTEFQAIWEQIEHDLEHHDHDHDDDHEHAHDHEHHDHDQPASDEEREEMKAEYRDIAVRRVRLGLLLSEIGRANGIEVTPEDMQQAVIDRARQFPGQEARVVQYYQQNPEAMQELTAPILEDRVVDHLIGQIKVNERPVTPSEFFAVEEADHAEGEGESEEGNGDEAASSEPAPEKKKKAAVKAETEDETGETKPKKATAKAEAKAEDDTGETKPKKARASKKKKKTEEDA